MKHILVGCLRLKIDVVKLVEVGVVGAEVGDECVHLFLVSEADVGNEFHETLQELWMAADKRAFDVVE